MNKNGGAYPRPPRVIEQRFFFFSFVAFPYNGTRGGGQRRGWLSFSPGLVDGVVFTISASSASSFVDGRRPDRVRRNRRQQQRSRLSARRQVSVAWLIDPTSNSSLTWGLAGGRKRFIGWRGKRINSYCHPKPPSQSRVATDAVDYLDYRSAERTSPTLPDD